MPANVDITNQKFGRLIALYMTDKGSTELVAINDGSFAAIAATRLKP